MEVVKLEDKLLYAMFDADAEVVCAVFAWAAEHGDVLREAAEDGCPTTMALIDAMDGSVEAFDRHIEFVEATEPIAGTIQVQAI